MARKRLNVQAWVWAVLILGLLVGVVVFSAIRKHEEPMPTSATVPVTKVPEKTGSSETPSDDAESTADTSTVPAPSLQINFIDFVEDGLLIGIGKDTRQEYSGVDHFIMNHTPLRFRWKIAKHDLVTYWFSPEGEQLERLAGPNVYARPFNDLLILCEWNEDARCDIYIRTGSGDSIFWASNRSTSDPMQAYSGRSIMSEFPERGQFLASQFEIDKADVLSSTANSLVRRFSDKWECRGLRKRSIRTHLELWDSHMLEKPSQVGPEAASIYPPSMLFGENKDVFLVVERYEKEADLFLVGYSLEPLARKARIRLKKGTDWVEYGRGREPNELVAILQEDEEDCLWGFAWVKYDPKTGLTMQRFEPGTTIKNGWMVQWHGELAFYKNPPNEEFTIAKGEEKVVVCGLKDGFFAISEDGTQVTTWTKNRFDLWDVDFPSVTHRAGYSAVRERATDELRFEPEIAPPQDLGQPPSAVGGD
mgnify:CR=1 FL=1